MDKRDLFAAAGHEFALPGSYALLPGQIAVVAIVFGGFKRMANFLQLSCQLLWTK